MALFYRRKHENMVAAVLCEDRQFISFPVCDSECELKLTHRPVFKGQGLDVIRKISS